MNPLRSLALASILLCSLATLAAPAPKEKFHLYLLVGQSNMAGRAPVEQQDKTPDPRVFALDQNGQWVPAVEPLHFDKPKIAGVGPGLAFGKAMAEADANVTIGLIPCAVGGSPLASWQPKAVDEATGTTPYDTAIARARLAMKDGTLEGILWHQGESDSTEKLAPKYGNNLEQTLGRLRDELGNPRACIVVGELGKFFRDKNPWAERVNTEIRYFGRRFDRTASVSADGLVDKGDQTHFDGPSVRELGRRYAAAMLKMGALPAPQIVRVWPDGLPDGKPLDKPEDEHFAHVSHVSDPTLSVYLPPRDKANGTAVVICPGGGYSILAIEKEGDCVARWLNDLGVAGIVLKSRLKDYKQPSPVLDAQQAIRLVRENASAWGIDPNRVGIMGFSAGGHLAAATSNAEPIALEAASYRKYNAIDCRPNFSILIYGVVPQAGDKWVKEMYTAIAITPRTPPAFLVTTKDDPIPSHLSVDYAAAMTRLNLPAEVHVYDKGGHGYGLGQSGGPVATWPEACANWLKARGFVR
ncbi:MAG TPA: sialate O-acetylesterase [Tepidisphaeraceae bacterium]|jgi:acetyl esterase/lipase